MGDAADAVVGRVKLIGEYVCVGVDDAEEIIDGVRDGVELGRRKTVHSRGGLFKRKCHVRALSIRQSKRGAVDRGDDGVLQGSGGDVRENNGTGGACLRGCELELGIGDGEQSDEWNRTQPVVELPGGQKLLRGRVAEVKQKSLPLLGI